MSDLHATYTTRDDPTRESDAATLARVYRFVLDAASERRKKAAEGSGSNDGKEINNAPANGIIPR